MYPISTPSGSGPAEEWSGVVMNWIGTVPCYWGPNGSSRGIVRFWWYFFLSLCTAVGVYCWAKHTGVVESVGRPTIETGDQKQFYGRGSAKGKVYGPLLTGEEGERKETAPATIRRKGGSIYFDCLEGGVKEGEEAWHFESIDDVLDYHIRRASGGLILYSFLFALFASFLVGRTLFFMNYDGAETGLFGSPFAISDIFLGLGLCYFRYRGGKAGWIAASNLSPTSEAVVGNWPTAFAVAQYFMAFVWFLNAGCAVYACAGGFLPRKEAFEVRFCSILGWKWADKEFFRVSCCA